MTVYGPYTPVRKAGDGWYFISGQIGVDAASGLASEHVEEQAHQALHNLQQLLNQNDLTFADVVKTTVFLKNMDDFPAVNAVYMEYFPEPRPARSCVAVAELPKVAGQTTLLVEIEAVAYKPAGEYKS